MLLVTLLLMATGCGQGTETGNPGTGGPEKPQPNNYSNDDFDVSLEYDNDWSFEEEEAAGETQAPVSDGDGEDADVGEPMIESGIDTSDAPSTEFTDGTTTVTLYFVTLSEEPESLEAFLSATFPSRTFESFSNSNISGLTYDNSEAGATGGDRQEYYFLDGTTLLYIVTDLFEANDGFDKFDTIIDSIRFD